jgi:hypothetical protein
LLGASHSRVTGLGSFKVERRPVVDFDAKDGQTLRLRADTIVSEPQAQHFELVFTRGRDDRTRSFCAQLYTELENDKAD